MLCSLPHWIGIRPMAYGKVPAIPFLQTSPMSAHPSHYRIGLAANRSHQDAPDSALVRLLRGSRPAIERLQPELIVVGRTLDAIGHLHLLQGYGRIERFPY